jgi:hypothetical protein
MSTTNSGVGQEIHLQEVNNKLEKKLDGSKQAGRRTRGWEKRLPLFAVL